MLFSNTGCLKVWQVILILASIVVAVICAALIINKLFPNVTAQFINYAEDMFYKVTHASFDFNQDGIAGGSNGSDYSSTAPGGAAADEYGQIEGWN